MGASKKTRDAKWAGLRLLLVLCGTMADHDDSKAIPAWGEAHLAFLRGYRPYHHGVPGGHWLTSTGVSRVHSIGRSSLQRRSIALAQRSWHKKHGHLPALPHQSYLKASDKKIIKLA